MCTNDEIHKMNHPSSREADFSTKQEAGSISTDDGKTTTTRASSSSSATPWLKSKDPRIVRVSRAFGGKDRHSKVCTVKGLRDRRVRLSVPTAIQLYDLQDRLGLNQPSKVVDWLLNAAKHEIDELPPLQIPPGNFIQNQHSFVPPPHHHHQGSGGGASQTNNRDGGGGYKISSGIDWEEDQTGLPRLNNFWNSSTLSRSKSKVFERDTVHEKENWIKRNIEEEKQEEGIDNINAQVLPSNFFPRNNNHHSSLQLQGLLNSVMPYGSAYYHLEPSNFTFSQLGSHGITSSQQQQTADQDNVQNFNVLPLQPTLSLPSGSTTHHVLVCPQGTTTTTTQAYFPSSHIPATSMEFDPRHFNHFHMLSSTTGSQNLLSTTSTTTTLPSLFSSTSSQSMRPFQLSMTPPNNHIVSQNDDSPSQPNKDTN